MKPVLLIVDDEESVRESFRLALQDDYKITFAENAKTELPVLMSGEMGSGVEEAAREIHSQSLRGTWPFITVSCAALSKNQMEKELFGEEGDESKGRQPQIGKLEFADKGTLFLDQVDRLP